MSNATSNKIFIIVESLNAVWIESIKPKKSNDKTNITISIISSIFLNNFFIIRVLLIFWRIALPRLFAFIASFCLLRGAVCLFCTLFGEKFSFFGALSA